uniref:Uncharacterized protein n=1 Tax=Octopus bimaculoides TaxID=37653 RepID=A0A0L8H7E5_OCTBM
MIFVKKQKTKKNVFINDIFTESFASLRRNTKEMSSNLLNPIIFHGAIYISVYIY